MLEWLNDFTTRVRAATKATIVFLFVAVPAGLTASVGLLAASTGLATMAVLTIWLLVMLEARKLAGRVYEKELGGDDA